MGFYHNFDVIKPKMEKQNMFDKLIAQAAEDKAGKKKEKKAGVMDTSKFDSSGKVLKEYMYIGPMGGECPLPPDFKIQDLNLFPDADENILVSSWISDHGPQHTFDDKLLFYNNESILNDQSLLNHFKKKHKSKFLNHNIEFLCKKGQHGAEN